MNSPGEPKRADILYGVAGWSYADWEGIVYPSAADAAAKMLGVARLCDLIEINTTFYHTPPPSISATWARRLAQANLNTRLVVKLNKVFTHGEDYSATDLREFREALVPLDDSGVVDRNGVEHPRLMGLLVQFPAWFAVSPANSQRLERIAEDFSDWTRVVELRHSSWARSESRAWLKRLGCCMANIDQPASEAAATRAAQHDAPPNAFPRHVVATGPLGYLRLHGRNASAWFKRDAAVDQKYNYLYQPGELEELANRVRELSRQTSTVAVVGNNHYRGKALATVLNLANLVDGRQSRVPAPLLEEYPQLREFAEAEEFAPPAPKPAKSRTRIATPRAAQRPAPPEEPTLF